MKSAIMFNLAMGGLGREDFCLIKITLYTLFCEKNFCWGGGYFKMGQGEIC